MLMVRSIIYITVLLCLHILHVWFISELFVFIWYISLYTNYIYKHTKRHTRRYHTYIHKHKHTYTFLLACIYINGCIVPAFLVEKVKEKGSSKGYAATNFNTCNDYFYFILFLALYLFPLLLHHLSIVQYLCFYKPGVSIRTNPNPLNQ